MKKLLILLLMLLYTGCAASKNAKQKSTISCFKENKMILRMKANGEIQKEKNPLYEFIDDRGFIVEIYDDCVIVYTDNSLYEKFNR